MNREKFLRAAVPVAAVVASVGIGFAGITSAQVTSSNTSGAAQTQQMRGGFGGQNRPAVVGTVASVSGSTFMVTSQKPGDTTSTTYTVDASSATVMKAAQGAKPATSTVSAIAVGDEVAVEGTVSGTSVTATKVMDGMMPFGGRGRGGPGGGHEGTVTAVNGSTITITGENGTTYTVDGSSAKVSKTSTITVGDIQVGDRIGVQGSTSGTTITAKDIMDGVPQRPNEANAQGTTQ